MSGLGAIQDALADVIRTAVNGNGIDVQVEGRYVPNPTPPCIDIYPADLSMDPASKAMGDIIGGDRLFVRVRVDPPDNTSMQDLLLEFMDDEGDLSVGAAITDDPSLGGMLGGMEIQERTGFQQFPTVQGELLLGCLFTVAILKAYS